MRTISAIDKGSSPRVRGEGHLGAERVFDGGIIPAGAGRSHGLSPSFAILRDHPRGCGEKLRTLLLPRVISGIIPAGAGRSEGQ